MAGGDREAGAGAREDALVRSAVGGDAAAWEELARRHYRLVHALSFHLVGSPEDAEDLAQESFVRAFRGLGCFRRGSSLAAWLRRIVVHLARDRYRREGRRPDGERLEGTPPDRRAGPVQEVGARELARRLDAALRELPEGPRLAFLLRVRSGLSYPEAAAAAGVTEATARTQVARARRQLLRSLAPFLSSPPPPSARIRASAAGTSGRPGGDR